MAMEYSEKVMEHFAHPHNVGYALALVVVRQRSLHSLFRQDGAVDFDRRQAIQGWGIGYQNQLLFHISPDLERFRTLTAGGVLVMGPAGKNYMPSAWERFSSRQGRKRLSAHCFIRLTGIFSAAVSIPPKAPAPYGSKPDAAHREQSDTAVPARIPVCTSRYGGYAAAHHPEVSDFLVTEPYGLVEQDKFLNGAMKIRTLLTPHELLDRLNEIEQTANRVPPALNLHGNCFQVQSNGRPGLLQLQTHPLQTLCL